MAENEKVLKYEITETNITEQGGVETSKQTVEIEVLPAVDLKDKRRAEINKNIADIDDRLDVVRDRVEKLNSEIDNLTNHADGIDYAVAVASGIIAGIIDSVWVGEFSIERADNWGNEKANDLVVKIAKSQGYQGDDPAGAIRFLENKYPIAADSVTNKFGGGLQHHIRDFSHHPTPVGLIFSLLTQFTGNVYGKDVNGLFIIAPVGEEGQHLIGKDLPQKIVFGVVNWFFHMVSDMAGSSTSAIAGKLGTGLPGPLVSLLSEISSLPFFRNLKVDGKNEFSAWVSKLFNGTLLGKKDANGKVIEPIKFDLRTEIGVLHEIGRQAVPVIINECIVRGFYFIRRLYQEIKAAEIKNISDLGKINWKKTLPFKNRTVARMLTISTSTFLAFDIIDAAIRSGGFNAACILRINYVGVGRFAIAIGTDIGMGIKKSKKENERMKLKGEQIKLLGAKMFYKQTDMWIEAQNTDEAIQQAYVIMEQTMSEFADAWAEIEAGSEDRKKCIDAIKNNDKEFADELADLLEWGI